MSVEDCIVYFHFDEKGFNAELMKQLSIHGASLDLAVLAIKIFNRFCHVSAQVREDFPEFIEDGH